jgi:hypothetical protein
LFFFLCDFDDLSLFRGGSRSVDFRFVPLPASLFSLREEDVTLMTLRMAGLRGELFSGDASRLLRQSTNIGELFGDERGVELAEFERADKILIVK